MNSYSKEDLQLVNRYGEYITSQLVLKSMYIKTTLIRGGLSICVRLHCPLKEDECENKSSQVQETFIGS